MIRRGAYSNTQLKNLNFTIKPNEKVMIAGSTGSGKSILVKTLVGFYDYEGSINIGEYEVRDLNKKDSKRKYLLIIAIYKKIMIYLTI